MMDPEMMRKMARKKVGMPDDAPEDKPAAEDKPKYASAPPKAKPAVEPKPAAKPPEPACACKCAETHELVRKMALLLNDFMLKADSPEPAEPDEDESAEDEHEEETDE